MLLTIHLLFSCGWWVISETFLDLDRSGVCSLKEHTVNSLLATTSRKRPPLVSDHFENNRFVFQSNTVSKTLSDQLVDELNKLASSQGMGLHIAQLVDHCSTNAEATGSRNFVDTPKTYFRATSQLLKLRFNCDGHVFISKYRSPRHLQETKRAAKPRMI